MPEMLQPWRQAAEAGWFTDGKMCSFYVDVVFNSESFSSLLPGDILAFIDVSRPGLCESSDERFSSDEKVR